MASQNAAGGWDYAPNTARNDLSVTGWWLRGLVYARAGGVDVPDTALQRTLAFVIAATATNGVCSYTLAGSTIEDVRAEAGNTRRDAGTVAPTGISLLTQQMLGQRRSAPVLLACADRILTDLPNATNLNLYQWYYCTQALATLARDNPHWIHYRWHVKTALEEGQTPRVPATDLSGSFSDQHGKFLIYLRAFRTGIPRLL